MKKLSALAIPFLLVSTASWADGSEPLPKGRSSTPTVLVVCQKSAYPNGMYCGAPSYLDGTWDAGDLDNYLLNTLGCSRPETSVYNCQQGGLNGVAMIWTFTGTSAVSSIVYTWWPVASAQ